MKFFAAFALIVAVASAGVVKPIGSDESQINAIIAAINSPSTDPATAVLLEQQLAALLGIAPPSPAIVDPVHPILVVDEAIDSVIVVDDVSPVVVVDEVAPVSPVIVVDEAAPVAPVINPPVAPVVNPSPASSPLVQVILNINAPAGALEVSPVIVPPVAPVLEDNADAVIVVDEAVNEIDIPEPVVLPPTPVVVPPVLEPIVIVDPIFPSPVAPVIIGEPTLPVVPQPVVTLPESIN